MLLRFYHRLQPQSFILIHRTWLSAVLEASAGRYADGWQNKAPNILSSSHAAPKTRRRYANFEPNLKISSRM